MKLTQEEIHQIELYLESKELYQIDLKQEVLDHMANAVEDKMKTDKATFLEAFELEKNNWKDLLRPYGNYLLGIKNIGPKIMMRKCVEMMTNVLLKGILISFLVAIVVFYTLKSYISEAVALWLNNILGTIFIIVGVLVGLMLYKLGKSEVKSSFQYFLKLNSISYIIGVIAVTPFFEQNEYSATSIGFALIFTHCFMLLLSFHLYKIYQKHQLVSEKLA